MDRRFVFTATAALALGGIALGQQPATPSQPSKPAPQKDVSAEEIKPLHIGDKAPALDIEHWVKGDKVAKFLPDHVYVVEFWATWCGPCRASMPHLSETQERFKDYDVTVIGISDEDLDTIKGFLKEQHPTLEKPWNDVIEYTLTTDEDKSNHTLYMHGVGAMGIPTAFIIGKDGRLEWVGHPQELDKPLDQVVRGEWDRQAFAKDFEPQAEKDRAELAEYLREAAKTKPHTEALKKAIAAGDADAAMAALDKLIALADDPTGYQFQKFNLLVTKFNRPKEAYQIANELAQAHWEDSMLLNQIAWTIVDTDGIKVRDLDIAMKLANRANELTKEQDGAILDTVARVYYEKGDLDKAIEIQKQAVKFAPAGPMGEELKATLKKYEDEKKNG